MIRSFVAALRKDLYGVRAALTPPWTTSPVDGQVSRLKMLTRTMYGRAGFHLLAAPVLNAEMISTPPHLLENPKADAE